MIINSTLHKERRDARIKAMNPQISYSGFDLMSDISQMAERAIKKSYKVLEKNLFEEKSPSIAIFLYGSGGRGEMTNYSDIDIHFISAIDDPQASVFQEKLHKELASYQFGKIDDPNWKNMKSVEKYAARSITEANQIFDAKLVAGDKGLAKELTRIIEKYDTQERKIRNMLFQKFYLEHYYGARSNVEVPNVKYCSGGYRDLLTFDWFSNWISSTKGLPSDIIGKMPQIQYSLKDIGAKGIITNKKERLALDSAEFMVLFRNEVLHSNIGTKDEGITHLDIPTMERTFSSSPEYFCSLGVFSPNQLLPLFNEHAKVIKNTKKKILDYIISVEGKNRGGKWLRDYKDSLAINISNQRRKEIAKQDDVITKLSSIWGMNYNADTELFNEVCGQMIGTTQWEALASMACSPKSSPELLSEIAKTSMSHEGLGYILRILGRNPSTSKGTLEDIAGNSSLDKRYRIVAKLNLEKGLYIATTRSS